MTNPDLSAIYNYLPISETLGTAGQPSAAQFATVKQAGYEVVINLAVPDSPQALPGEAEIVAQHGMAYIPIPVVWSAPTADDLDEFFAAMERNQGKRCFVHCIANIRVSSFVFLYRVIQQSEPVEQAGQQLHRIWEPNPIWAEFIADELAARGISGWE